MSIARTRRETPWIGALELDEQQRVLQSRKACGEAVAGLEHLYHPVERLVAQSDGARRRSIGGAVNGDQP
jgi:hypothetical protein